ncbi:MAG: response regulator [Cyanophyceae cyanobacterium]
MNYELLPLSGLRVLVVDNHCDSRDLLKIIFEVYGMTVMMAASAGEALKILQQDTIDLLVSEVRLPNEDGYSLMRQVKAKVARRVPAIALTTCARECDRYRSLAVGFDYHLTKPIEIDDLMATVTELAKKLLVA